MFCHLRISIAGSPPRTVVFQLRPDQCPKACDNFAALCASSATVTRPRPGTSISGDVQPTYRGTEFHRIIPGFMIQGGDFTKFDGTGGHAAPSTNEGKLTFNDEGFDISHDKEGVLSMANKGKHTNGSQFFVTLGKALHLDGKHVAFGHVVRGMEVIREAAKVETEGERPVMMQRVVIVDCGLGTGDDDGSSDSNSSSSESQSSDDRKRSRKRKKRKKSRDDDDSYHRKRSKGRSSRSKHRKRHDKEDRKRKKRKDKSSHRKRDYSSSSSEDDERRHSSKKRRKDDRGRDRGHRRRKKSDGRNESRRSESQGDGSDGGSSAVANKAAPQNEGSSNNNHVAPAPDPEQQPATSKPIAEATKPKGPMTQAQYQHLQSQLREVVDPHTGRTRLVRGTGEIVERIVSREEHARLNACATRGDGSGFAREIMRAAASRKGG